MARSFSIDRIRDREETTLSLVRAAVSTGMANYSASSASRPHIASNTSQLAIYASKRWTMSL